MKLFCKPKEKLPKREVFLKDALLDAQRNLQDAYDGLSNASEPDLIDSYIYALNAASLRYKVILRDYKTMVAQKSKLNLRTKTVENAINIQCPVAPGLVRNRNT